MGQSTIEIANWSGLIVCRSISLVCTLSIQTNTGLFNAMQYDITKINDGFCLFQPFIHPTYKQYLTGNVSVFIGMKKILHGVLQIVASCLDMYAKRKVMVCKVNFYIRIALML